MLQIRLCFATGKKCIEIFWYLCIEMGSCSHQPKSRWAHNPVWPVLMRTGQSRCGQTQGSSPGRTEVGQAARNQGVLCATRNWKRWGIILPSWLCGSSASYWNLAELEENVFPLFLYIWFVIHYHRHRKLTSWIRLWQAYKRLSFIHFPKPEAPAPYSCWCQR